MKREKTDNADRFIILKFLVRELAIILGLASFFWLIKKDGTFIMCCKHSAWLMSLASICHLGLEIIPALDYNHWRIKLTNKEYYVYKALILILLNALVVLLTGPERGYFIFIVPIIMWGMMIMINRISRWFRF